MTNIRTFVDPQDPNHVAVLMDVADMDALMAAMSNPEAAAAIEHDGVGPRRSGSCRAVAAPRAPGRQGRRPTCRLGSTP